MPDRDWEKELAEIDKRLGAVPEEAPAASPARVPATRPAPSAPRDVAAKAPPVPPTTPTARRPWVATAGLLARLLVAALLLAVVVVWPYDTRCGAWLAGYLATIGITMLAALWTSVAAWRHRGALTHVLALGVFTTAGVYGAREILPRVGYAMPDPAHPTMWACK